MNEVELTGRPRPLRRLFGIAAFLAIYAGLTAGFYSRLAGPRAESAASLQVVAGLPPPTRNVGVKDGLFHVDGEPFFVSAVGWDPARPGELPWTRAFDAKDVDADFSRIRAAGFNTIRTWASLRPEELELAVRHGLRVLQGVWVPPDADFRDPHLRRRVLGEVLRHVQASRWSPAILAYLVMNEPRAHAVAGAGLDATAAFLREVVATVRALDPSAPVGYASWPGMEALDDDLLDFVAFNLYPHRPRVVMDELGLVGYASLILRTVGRGRPFLVSEFGISVSPQAHTPGRGGASEDEQARGLVDLSEKFVAAGAAGTAVFQWNDGWWKNNDGAGDEAIHDPADPEEWFGLLRFESARDRLGAPRPALAALARKNRAILVEPRDGPVDPEAVPVRVFTTEPLLLGVRFDGGPASPVPLARSGSWLSGTLRLPPGGERQDVELELYTAKGEVVQTSRRLLRARGPRQAALALEPRLSSVRPGAPFTVTLTGTGAIGSRVSVATYTEDRYNEQHRTVRLGPGGRARVRLVAPDHPTVMTVLAFEDDPSIPPAERASAWTAVEVRR